MTLEEYEEQTYMKNKQNNAELIINVVDEEDGTNGSKHDTRKGSRK